MSRNSGTEEGVELLFKIIFFTLFIGFFLIYWLIKGIIKIIVYIKNNSETKKKNASYSTNSETIKPKNNIITNEINCNLIIPKNNITDEEIIRKLNLYDTRMYNDLFEEKIKIRGEEYYNSGKVKNVKNDNNTYSCQIEGTNKYDVSIEFKDINTGTIKNVSCTCPYFVESKHNCKHIYSLLYNLKCGENKEKIIDEIFRISNTVFKLIYDYKNQIEQKKMEYTVEQIKFHTITVEKYKQKLDSIIEKVQNSKNEKELIKLLKDTIDISKALEEYEKAFLRKDFEYIEHFTYTTPIIERNNNYDQYNIMKEEIDDEDLDDDDIDEDDFEFDEDEFDEEPLTDDRDFATKMGEYMLHRDFFEDVCDKKLDGVEKYLLWKHLEEKNKKK